MNRVPIQPDQVWSFKTHMYRSMARAVQLLYGGKEFHAAVALILSYIEALAGGGDDKCRKALEDDFPELCKELSAHQFYDAFRKGFLHLFIPKGDYALVREAQTEGDYFRQFEVLGESRVLTGLNVDRFIREFLDLVEKRERAAAP